MNKEDQHLNHINSSPWRARIFAIFLVLTILAPRPAHAQVMENIIQVIKDIAEYAEEAINWAEQYTNLLTQNTDLEDEVQIMGGGFTQVSNAMQLNAEENKTVAEGTSQAIIDNKKIVSQASGAADLQANAVVPTLSTGCTIASAQQKRNVAQAAANEAANGYTRLVLDEGTAVYGAVPDNSGLSSVSKRLCGRMGGSGGTGWTFLEAHGGLESQLKCQQ